MRCKDMNRLVSTSITYDTASGNTVVTVPNVLIPSLENLTPFCLVFAQTFPTSNRTAPIVISDENSNKVPLLGISGNVIRQNDVCTRTPYPVIYGDDPSHFSMTRKLKNCCR